jgi:hypothetical protein
MNEATTLHGVIHGDTIKLAEDPHMRDGEEVTVVIKRIATGKVWGEGLRLSAGALADDPEADADFEEIYQARKNSKPREIPED